jgi:hypothetical protein
MSKKLTTEQWFSMTLQNSVICFTLSFRLFIFAKAGRDKGHGVTLCVTPLSSQKAEFHATSYGRFHWRLFSIGHYTNMVNAGSPRGRNKTAVERLAVATSRDSYGGIAWMIRVPSRLSLGPTHLLVKLVTRGKLQRRESDHSPPPPPPNALISWYLIAQLNTGLTFQTEETV